MKKLGIPLFIMILALSPTLFARTEAWISPVHPGMDEWNALSSHDEMVKACSIPGEILDEMGTDELLQACLSYPLLPDAFLAFDSLQVGFDTVSSEFNGFPALFAVDDAGSAVLTRYLSLDPEAIDRRWTSVMKGEYAAHCSGLAVLLAQGEILGGLSDGELVDLLEKTVDDGQ